MISTDTFTNENIIDAWDTWATETYAPISEHDLIQAHMLESDNMSYLDAIELVSYA